MSAAMDPGWYFAENLTGIPDQLNYGHPGLPREVPLRHPDRRHDRRRRAGRHRHGRRDRQQRRRRDRRAAARRGGQGEAARGDGPRRPVGARRLPLPRLLLAGRHQVLRPCSTRSRRSSTATRTKSSCCSSATTCHRPTPPPSSRRRPPRPRVDLRHRRPPPTLRQMIDAHRNLLVLSEHAGGNAAVVHEGLRHLPGHAVHVRVARRLQLRPQPRAGRRAALRDQPLHHQQAAAVASTWPRRSTPTTS